MHSPHVYVRTQQAVGRAARSLAPAPPVELITDNIRKLHGLHTVEEKPAPPLQMPEALQIDEATLAKACRDAPRGSAAAIPMHLLRMRLVIVWVTKTKNRFGCCRTRHAVIVQS